jgi:hypothetical protein
VPVQAEIVSVVEFACRKRLIGASQEQGELDLIKFGLVADVQQIDEHRRAGIAERIELGGLDQRLFLFADFFLDERTPLITGQSAPHALAKYFTHAGRQLHAFHSADFLTAHARQNELACLGGTDDS